MRIFERLDTKLCIAESEGRVVAMLVSRASLQAAVGLTTLLLLVWIGVF